jgi:DNA (cytosine-5)-methyltransferase 1
VRIGSLFAGIGGFDLAARWVGWETAWFSEIEPYASAVLAKHWPGVPNHGDITKIKGSDVEAIDLLCGGFPCQDISFAGKGAGITGARSGLWSHYARLIDEIRPRWVVAENVPALRSRGLDQVLGSLAEIGYDAEWHCIPAAAVGAPHRRDRIWIIAYPHADHAGPQGRLGALLSHVAHSLCLVGESCGSRDACEGARGRDAGRSGVSTHDERRPLDDALFGRHVTPEGSLPAGRNGVIGASWWAVEPDVGRVAHGVPARVDRLRCLGNAIVPLCAYVIFQAIQAAEEGCVARAA